ncbi:MAG: hypothetical protein LIO90_10985 [Bacteroidales bacterium]|nr:hypothetical protein [Bacteroidales bacterium]
MKYILPALLMAAATLTFTACDDDESKINPSNVTGKVYNVQSASIAEGASVDPANTTSLEVVYDGEVALSTLVSPTLNGQAVTATMGDDQRTLTVELALAAGVSYTFEIPQRAVAGINSGEYAEPFTLSFSTPTKEIVVPPTSFLDLCNTSATAEAKAVYAFLQEQNGKKILSGAMANVNNNNRMADWIYSISGKYPAITGYDFISHLYSGSNWIDYTDITPAKTQWEANGLVSYMWHWFVPTDEDAWRNADYDRYGCRVPGDDVTSATEFDIRNAVEDGTWENECILADIDQIAGYLKLLQDAGIPVLWRPLHEAAGSYKWSGAWFWWGRYGDEYTTKLWKLMYDRLVNYHALNNLIWVWTAQYEEGYESQMEASYPGNEYVDIVGTDIYADEGDESAQYAAYAALMSMTGGKRMVTISETGYLQSTEECLAAGAGWSYFMLWYTYDIASDATHDSFGNTAEHISAVMNASTTLNREDMPSLK